jgi:hypothetical protein
MSDSILNRLVTKPDLSTPRRADELEETEDLNTFGWLRGVRDRALMLELRFRDGNLVSLGYPWLERAVLDASTGILLQFGNRIVRIVGRNLNSVERPGVRLYAGIIRHRVPWIQESTFGEDFVGEKRGVFIESINIQ